MKVEDKDRLKGAALKILSRHVGANRKIGMGELYFAVFGESWSNRINDTRALRKVITELRQEGVPICSVADSTGGGYYLASVDSELHRYLERLRTQALKKLALEAKIRRISMHELLGQMTMNFRAEEEGEAA